MRRLFHFFVGNIFDVVAIQVPNARNGRNPQKMNDVRFDSFGFILKPPLSFHIQTEHCYSINDLQVFEQGAIQSCKKSVQHGADKISRAVYKGGSIERFFSLPLQFRYGDDAASRLNEDTPLFIEGKHGARDLGRSGGIA